jgi:site-specific recombinase XerD
VITARGEVAEQPGTAVIGVSYASADFDVPPATATLIAEAVPANTALAYRSRWRSFEAWCAHAGRVALPATAQTVAAYLTHLATERGLKATTVDAHLTAIRAVHRGAGAPAPDPLTGRKVVVAAQRREAAQDGRYGPRKAAPVMAADLPAIVAACDDRTPVGLRDRAVVLLGFALLARRSELAALNLSDVELAPGEGIAVTIRASKTDQSARGVIRRIHYAANERVCPVRAVLAWTAFLAAGGVMKGPLFTRIDRWGNVGPTAGGRYAGPPASDKTTAPAVSGGNSRDGRLRPQAIGAIVTALCASAGLAGQPAESRRYSGHSLRRGGATSMLAAGAQPLHVSRHGRWSDGSRSFAGYVEEATGFGDANPTKGLLLSTPRTPVLLRWSGPDLLCARQGAAMRMRIDRSIAQRGSCDLGARPFTIEVEYGRER